MTQPANISVKLRKDVSAPGLLTAVRGSFEKIPDHRKVKGNVTYSLADALMSGLAIFGMKFPSLLQFETMGRTDEYVKHNLKSLYFVKDTPSDTQVREILDPVDPKQIRKAFKRVFALLQRAKAIEKYQFYRGAVLVSIDGTGYFSSNDVHCENCCVKEHRNGSLSYYHQMLGAVVVHPDQTVVLPLAPEPIIKQDGNSKNDCERNASKRLLEDLRREHPHLSMIIVEDSLASNAPHIELLKDLKFNFILGVKPGDHKFLFDNLDTPDGFGELTSHIEEENNVVRRFRFINKIPLNDASKDNLLINFLEMEETVGGKTTRFSWVTDIHLSTTNVAKIAKGGRARWKIENETFNTLKNQGYQFEHNFGHGKKNLSVNFAMLMMLAFLVDQAQELCCTLFRTAKNSKINRKAFWEKVRAIFRAIPIDNWEDLYNAVAYGYKFSGLTVNTT